MELDKKWLIVTILSIALLFITLFAPFLKYHTDNGIETHSEFVYYNGAWKNIDSNQTSTIVVDGNYLDWDGNFKIASPILLLLGISIMIVSSIALIFSINDKWALVFRGVILLGSVLGFIGIMVYVPFAIYVFQLTFITLHVSAMFVIEPLILGSVIIVVVFSTYSMFVKKRERTLEKRSV